MANPRTIARLEARIQERAAYCLQFELQDPRSTFVTITKVELSKDIEHAKVYWSHYGTPGERRRAAEMLEHASGFIRRQVARVLKTRKVPRLRFVFDESIEQAAEMDLLIQEARRRDAEVRGEDPEVTRAEDAELPGQERPAEDEEVG